MDLEQNYKNNMEFLKNGWSQVYESVKKADISDYELNLTPLGEYNISKNGSNIYPARVDTAIQAQVNAFLDNPPAFFKKPTWNQSSERGYFHDELISSIETNSSYIKENKNFESYHKNLGGYFPFLLMMGIGAGYHLEKLIKQSNDIKEIIIVDESYELLKISFHLIDWRPIFLFFKQKNHGLFFVITENSQEAVNITLNTIYKYFSYQFHFVPFYTHYRSKFFDEFKKKLLDKINLGFSGQGFYDDEIISLEHTLKNLSNNLPIFRFKNKLPKKSTVFLIGSGPSLDDDIENIKKHKDDVIIVSCGTSLGILYRNGIKPDFHMEIERPPEMLPIIEHYGSKEFLKSIDIIGLNVVNHKVFELFKTAKIFFRENDAGSSIVPKDVPKLKHCNPTIVNGALSFLTEIGFQNIFMFGTDMGFRSIEKHHSKDSIYYTTHHTGIDLNKQEYSGNFDRNEKFLSTPIFIWCKQRAENCITESSIYKRDINYFNCSDGLHINGTTPFSSKNIKINKVPTKNEVLKGINNSFDSDFNHLYEEIEIIFNTEKLALFENIKNIEKYVDENKIDSFKSLFTLISETFNLVNNPNIKQDSYLTRSILKGTMYHFYSSLYTHSLATTNKEEAFNYIEKSLIKLKYFLNEAKSKIENISLK